MKVTAFADTEVQQDNCALVTQVGELCRGRGAQLQLEGETSLLDRRMSILKDLQAGACLAR
jgi:hypothetical protein